LWDYEKNRILKGYHHTFFQDFKTLAIVGLPRVLTFRSFEYQAIALARLWSGRNSVGLPGVEEMIRWEEEREKERKASGKKFHDVDWDSGETFAWLDSLYRIAGLRALSGEGRTPPVLGAELRWAIEHLRKYPEPGKGEGDKDKSLGIDRMDGIENDEEWVLVNQAKNGERKDLLSFI
jgi:hypothetical protein